MSNVTELPKQNQRNPELVGWNRAMITIAFDAIYSTEIYSDEPAGHRGDAIRAINALCVEIGFDDLVRND